MKRHVILAVILLTLVSFVSSGFAKAGTGAKKKHHGKKKTEQTCKKRR